MKTFLFILITSMYIGSTVFAQTQLGLDIDGEASGDLSGSSISMPDATTVAIGAIFNDGNGSNAGHVRINTWNGSAWTQKGVDIDGVTASDQSGWSVSMPDANTVAIGAPLNDGNGTSAGHVRIYSWNGSTWTQKGVDIDGETAGDQSGYSVSMPDASTVAIGAINNDGTGSNAGHVRIYTWNGSVWTQKGADLDGEAAFDQSGYRVTMPDVNTVAIAATGNDGSGSDAGHVRIYTWNGSAWTQKGADIDGEAAGDQSGWSVSMPNDNTIAIGARGNSENGVLSGHVRIYTWNGSAWTQKGVDLDGELGFDQSGFSVSMPDANTVAVGAPGNDGNGNAAGHVRVYSLSLCTPTSGTDVQTACDSYTWIDGNTYTASNNTATWILTNAAGCDSIVTLDLTINNSNTGIDVQTACDSYTWIDGNTYTSSNNAASFTLTNAAGCDSIVTLDLTINNSNTGTDVITACETYTWIDGNTYTASNNTATHTLTNVAGCDSIVTLDLTINNSNTGTDVITACDSYTWIDGNTYTSSNNIATHTLTNVAGCDSVVTLDLTINNSNTGTDTQTACGSFTWIDGSTYTLSNNTATYTLTNAAGCDSIVTLDLTISTGINTNVDLVVNSTDDIVLIASASNAQYMWLDCDDNFSEIPVENNQTYVVTENGSYAVELTENGCVDTSDCIVVNNVSIPENEKSQIKIYPNPSNGTFTLESDLIGKSYTIIDAQGRLVQSGLIENQNATIKLENEQVGVYYLKVENRVLKLIKH